MKIRVSSRTNSGFTLAEMMIVISIIMVLAALTIGGYNYAMKGSKRRTTEATMAAVKSTLEEYLDKYGEYPEPASMDETYEVRPRKNFVIGGAKCLYQALRGDGFDAIKGGENSAAEGANPQSDGDFTTEEISQVMFKDMPPTMWRKIGGNYILIDAFNNPFQYTKAAETVGGAPPEPITINSTYDLWSYADDEQNTTMRSLDTKNNPSSANKWIKNW